MRPLCLMLALFAVACGRTELVRYTFPPGGLDAGPQLVPCMTGELMPRPRVPAVMLVVDRSGSMDFDLAGNTGGLFGTPLTGPTRWAVLRASLESTLSQFDQRVAFGMVMFPGDDGCGAPSSIELMPRAGNAGEVLARFDRGPAGGTPTFEAVNAAADLLGTVRGQAQVLITDGDPNCNPALDPLTCDCTAPRVGVPARCRSGSDCRDADRTVDGLRRLHQDRGIITYVVGVGSSNTSVLQALDNMAIAGGAPRTGGGGAFYSGATQRSLTEGLEAISTRLSRCTWSTGTRLGPNDLVTVSVGGAAVPRQADGWGWVDETSGDFVLQGSWCTRAAAGEPVLLRLDCR